HPAREVDLRPRLLVRSDARDRLLEILAVFHVRSFTLHRASLKLSPCADSYPSCRSCLSSSGRRAAATTASLPDPATRASTRPTRAPTPRRSTPRTSRSLSTRARAATP